MVALPIMAPAVLLAGKLQAPADTVGVAEPSALATTTEPGAAGDFAANPALSPLYFGAGRSTPRREDERSLDAHVSWLQRNGTQFLLIEGHTDGPGLDATSVAVGAQRAEWAKTYLVSRGVQADRIETISYGGAVPTCTEKTADCRARNRRATFSTTRR